MHTHTNTHACTHAHTKERLKVIYVSYFEKQETSLCICFFLTKENNFNYSHLAGSQVWFFFFNDICLSIFKLPAQCNFLHFIDQHPVTAKKEKGVANDLLIFHVNSYQVYQMLHCSENWRYRKQIYRGNLGLKQSGTGVKKKGMEKTNMVVT